MPKLEPKTDEKRTETRSVRFTPDEVERAEAAATAQGYALGTWMHDLVMAEVKDHEAQPKRKAKAGNGGR